MSTFHELREQCKRDGRLYVDTEFTPTDSSLYFSKKPPKTFEWKRPKEICDDPRLFVGGASRLDIKQGMLGDCWLLAAFGSLCSSPLKLMENVIPDDQNFQDDYAGIFHFRFWQYGEWTDVIVDDLLPTYNNRLVFLHSDDKNEFWCALLEKAFAKLHGSYEALEGGLSSEAMEDLTGGITEKFTNLAKCDKNKMWKKLVKSHQKSSLIACSIEAKPNEIEAAAGNGLVKGHAYSVTGVETLGNGTQLLRVRNPWGNEKEWTGAWSDGSSEWNRVPGDKARLYTENDDGEFWISMNDFCANFTNAEICSLGPEGPQDSFQEVVYRGGWRTNITAGGCRNFIDTFHINPQYIFTVEVDEDDDDGLGTVIIALMQKDRRKQKKIGGSNLTIGFSIYKIDEKWAASSNANEPLKKHFFLYNKSVARSDSFLNTRTVSKTLSLPPGKYALIPSTFSPGEQGAFYCRIFTEKDMKGASELDEENKHDNNSAVIPPASQQDKAADAKLLKTFKCIAGEDGEIDAFELRDKFLKPTLRRAVKVGVSDGLSLETCRSLLAIADTSLNGTLDFDEFKVIIKSLRKWMSVFQKFDKNNDGSFNAIELREALRSAGYSLSNKVYTVLGTRYAGKNGDIGIDDFIQLALKLEKMFAIFNKCAQSGGKKCEIPLQEFLISTMNS